MTARGYLNKRNFPRHLANIDFELTVSGRPFTARVIDFSLDGLGILVKKTSQFGSPVIHATIEEIGIDADGETRWARTVPDGVLVGVHLLGPIRGTLGTHRLSDVLLGLHKTKRTGVLEIGAGPTGGSICFRQGEVILPASRQDHRGVCELLLKSGKIGPDQYSRSLEAAQKTGRRQSTVLVELGFITATELSEGLRTDAEKILRGFFKLREESFLFRSDPRQHDEVIALSLDIEPLVFRGVKEIQDEDQIRRGCPPLDSSLFFVVNPSRLTKEGVLGEDDRKVVSLINGRRTLREILSLSPLGELESLRTIFALQNLQIIGSAGEEGHAGKKGSPDGAEAALDPRFAERIESIYQECKSHDYHKVLEVNRDASPDEIRRAYHRMAKEFHPDRYLHLDSDFVREKLHVIFSSISEAYRELSGPMGVPRDPPSPGEGAPQGEHKANLAAMRFREGKSAFSAGQYEQAATLFGQAVYLDGSKPEYHYFSALALLQNKKIKPAEEALRKASQLDPFNAKYVAELGHIYLNLGFKARAQSTFEKALKFDPSNERAREGMRSLAP